MTRNLNADKFLNQLDFSLEMSIQQGTKKHDLEKKVVTGLFMGSYPKNMTDIEIDGNKYRRFDLEYIKTGSSGIHNCQLFGEVPESTLEFLRGKRFSLKGYYRKRERIPLRQELIAIEESGPQIEYNFNRET